MEHPVVAPRSASEQTGIGVNQVLKALQAPVLLRQALRAQWQLRSCNSVPFTVRISGGRVFVYNAGRIEIGDRVLFDARTVPTEMVAWKGAQLRIGRATFVNYGVSLSAHQELTIGSNCLIGQYTIIMDSDYHDIVTRAMPGRCLPVTIEDNVWLGARVIVLPGVRIGQGSVVGAGSVVTKDIPAGCVAAGNPARVIREI
jgi:acetyltransferase-like isoleucine patch superfamily enzyme